MADKSTSYHLRVLQYISWRMYLSISLVGEYYSTQYWTLLFYYIILLSIGRYFL